MDKKRRIRFIIHLILIILAWLSPFYLNYKIIAFLVILYYIQIIIFKSCLLTTAQFKENASEMTMYTHSLEKLGFKINRKRLKFISSWIIPLIILFIAIIFQILLNLPTIL